MGVKTLNFKTLKDTVALGLTNAKRIVRWGWQERIRIKRFFLSATNHSIYDKIVVKKHTTLCSTFKVCGRNEVFKQLLKVVQYITRCILMKYQPSKKHSWHSPAVYEIQTSPGGDCKRHVRQSRHNAKQFVMLKYTNFWDVANCNRKLA